MMQHPDKQIRTSKREEAFGAVAKIGATLTDIDKKILRGLHQKHVRDKNEQEEDALFSKNWRQKKAVQNTYKKGLHKILKAGSTSILESQEDWPD